MPGSREKAAPGIGRLSHKRLEFFGCLLSLFRMWDFVCTHPKAVSAAGLCLDDCFPYPVFSPLEF